MWEPERETAQEVKCPLCSRKVRLGDARKCNSCRRVVCLDCFDVPMGVCNECVKKFDSNSGFPDYIA